MVLKAEYIFTGISCLKHPSKLLEYYFDSTEMTETETETLKKVSASIALCILMILK